MSTHSIIQALRQEAQVIRQDAWLDRIIEQIGDASIVLLGEATLGTREFYRFRMEISKRLIAEKGFDAIAVEADWPDTLHVNRFIRPRINMGGRNAADKFSEANNTVDVALLGLNASRNGCGAIPRLSNW